MIGVRKNFFKKVSENSCKCERIVVQYKSLKEVRILKSFKQRKG